MVRIEVFSEDNLNSYSTDKWKNAEDCCTYFDNAAYNGATVCFEDVETKKMVYLNPSLLREITFTNQER